jgi:hypothetical protein
MSGVVQTNELTGSVAPARSDGRVPTLDVDDAAVNEDVERVAGFEPKILVIQRPPLA